MMSSSSASSSEREEQLLRLFKSVVQKIITTSCITNESESVENQNEDYLFSADFYSQVHAEAGQLMERCCDLEMKSVLTGYCFSF